MNTKQTLKKALPYLVAVALFLLAAYLYFAPQTEGKVLQMNDITQYEGMSRDIKEHIASTGEDPQWTGAAFGGMPAYLINIKYPAMILKDASQKVLNFIGQPASLLFLAMLSFWIMLLLWGVSPWIAIVPALAYGFSTYSILIIGAGHITKMLAFAYAPLMAGGVAYTLRGKRMLLGALLTALFASLEIAANHPQITYYFAIVVAALWINEAVAALRSKGIPKFLKSTALLLVAAVFALGSNFSYLYYTYLHSSDTIRGGSELSADSQSSGKGLDLGYATAWSYGIDETVTLLIPNFEGGASSGSFSSDGQVAQSLTPYNARQLAPQLPSYWGKQPYTAGPTYIGAAILFLAILGLFVLKGAQKWWLVVVSLLAILLAWGSNFMPLTELMFRTLPGYDKFRTVSMILVVVQWAVPLMAALWLSKAWNGEMQRKELMRGLKWSFVTVGGLTLFLALFGRMIFSFDAPIDQRMGLPADVLTAMRSERGAMLAADSWRSFAMVALSAGAVWLFATERIKRWALALLLGAIVTFDLVQVDTRYLSWDSFVRPQKSVIAPTAADTEILQDTSKGYRVANFADGVNLFSDATTSYFHRSVGGYHGAKLARYQDLIDYQLSRRNPEAYNMLNTKYFITTNRETGQTEAVLNPDANGAAWFVDNIVWADSAEAEMRALDTVSTRSTAVVARRFEKILEGKPLGEGKIELLDYTPNRLVYQYDSAEGGVAVFSEIYYPKGWSARVDGRESDFFAADYVLRAMPLPAGRHTVEFRFRAPNFELTEWITMAFSITILCGLALYVAAVLVRRRIAAKKLRQNE
ncbi:MAG: YfhO family protein [Tidjanibacter sp.]|nr:YfhO family protein [Tidjanibacter sp.]